MSIDDYIKRPYKMEIIPDTEEGGYVVTFPDLPGCISIGDTIEEAIKNAEDAKSEWFVAVFEDRTWRDLQQEKEQVKMIPFEATIVREKSYQEYVMRNSFKYGYLDCLKKLREEIEMLNQNGGGIDDLFCWIEEQEKT